MPSLKCSHQCNPCNITNLLLWISHISIITSISTIMGELLSTTCSWKKRRRKKRSTCPHSMCPPASTACVRSLMMTNSRVKSKCSLQRAASISSTSNAFEPMLKNSCWRSYHQVTLLRSDAKSATPSYKLRICVNRSVKNGSRTSVSNRQRWWWLALRESSSALAVTRCSLLSQVNQIMLQRMRMEKRYHVRQLSIRLDIESDAPVVPKISAQTATWSLTILAWAVKRPRTVRQLLNVVSVGSLLQNHLSATNQHSMMCVESRNA